MRFQREPKPTPWLNRRDQHRILSFMLLLVLVILSIDMTRKPENWNWFFALSDQEKTGQQNPLSEIDFRVKEHSSELPLQAFVAVPTNVEQAELPQSPAKLTIQQIPRDELTGIEDQRIGRLRSEGPALERALRQVDAFSQQALLAAGRTDVGFRVVNVDPESYRGQLLTLTGRLWRLAPYPMGDAAEPRKDLVQAWIFTEDSGNNPWVVLLEQKPDGLEFGNSIDRQVKVAGYFFKRYGYPTEEGMHVAPLLVGKTLTVPPAVTVEQKETREVTYYVVGILAGIALLFGILILSFWWSDRKYRNSRAARIATGRSKGADMAPEDFSQLSSTNPTEMFQQLQDKESSS